MNFEVIVTCAVTGAGETIDKSPQDRKSTRLQPMFMCEIQ